MFAKPISLEHSLSKTSVQHTANSQLKKQPSDIDKEVPPYA